MAEPFLGVIASLLPGKAGMPIAARLLPSWLPDAPALVGPKCPSRDFDPGYSAGHDWASWHLADEHDAVVEESKACIQASVVYSVDSYASYEKLDMNLMAHARSLPHVMVELVLTVTITTSEVCVASGEGSRAMTARSNAWTPFRTCP